MIQENQVPLCGVCSRPLPFHKDLCPSYVKPGGYDQEYSLKEKETLQDAYEQVEDSYRSWRGL